MPKHTLFPQIVPPFGLLSRVEFATLLQGYTKGDVVIYLRATRDPARTLVINMVNKAVGGANGVADWAAKRGLVVPPEELQNYRDQWVAQMIRDLEDF